MTLLSTTFHYLYYTETYPNCTSYEACMCISLHPFRCSPFEIHELNQNWFMFEILINQTFVLILIIFWYFQTIHFNGPKWILLFRLSEVLAGQETQEKFDFFVPSKFQRSPILVQSRCWSQWWSGWQSLVSVCQNQISIRKQRSRWDQDKLLKDMVIS